MSLCLTLLTALLASQEIAAAGPADRIHADVAFLASDRLEGRATGSAGHRLAVDYVADRLRAAGFGPAAGTDRFIQQVPLRRAILVAGSVRARIGEGGRWHKLGPDAVRVAPGLARAELDLAAGLIFAGYGLDEPALGVRDYDAIDAREKIVVVLAGAPPGLGADIAAFVKGQKAAYAAARGAVGLIEVPAWPPSGRPSDLGRDPALAVDGWATATATGPGPDIARLTISSLLAERLFVGAPRRLVDIQRDALAGARPAGFALIPTLAVAARSQWRDWSSPQLIARRPGSDPTLAAQSVVVVAHIDHLGRVAPASAGGDGIANGALDNAAGVAILIEAARRLATAPHGLRRSVVVLITTAEELGDVGSDYAAGHWPAAAGTPVAALSLDMPLLLYHFDDIVAPGSGHSAIGPALAAAASPLGVALSPDPMPQQELLVRSDQLPFIRRGIPAALIVTGFFGGGEAAWADFLAHHYHQASDDLALPIRWNEGARLAVLIADAVRRLADATATPAWNDHDFFARRSGARPVTGDRYGH